MTTYAEELWDQPAANLEAIGKELEGQFAFLFDKLNVNGTADITAEYVRPVDVPLKKPAGP